MLGSAYVRVLSWEGYQQPTVAQFQLVVGLVQQRTWNRIELFQDWFLLFVEDPNIISQHHRAALVLRPQNGLRWLVCHDVMQRFSRRPPRSNHRAALLHKQNSLIQKKSVHCEEVVAPGESLI